MTTEEHAIGHGGAFHGLGKGWRGKVRKVCCDRCYGSGGGWGLIHQCDHCDGKGELWQLKAVLDGTI